MFIVCIEWEPGVWFQIGPPYATRDDAEWAVARWRHRTGHHPQYGDRGFKVTRQSD